jgi:hypothetical protein
VALVLGEGTMAQPDDAADAEGDSVTKRARRMKTTALVTRSVLAVKGARKGRELLFISA